MWRLISRSVGTHFSLCVCLLDWITHREFLISLDVCLVIVLIWDIGMLIVYLDWRFRLWQFFPCFIAIFVWDIDMLIMLIDHLALLSIVTLILPCLLWSPHMYTLTIVYHLIWHDWFSWLYIILIIMEHAIIARYSSRLACV